MKNTGRKVYHLLGGLMLLGVYSIFGPRRAFLIYLALLTAILVFDLARLRLPSFNRWALARMSTLLREGEAAKLSGSPTYILGVALTLFLFDLPVATAAVLFLAVGDVCATLVGESWGRTKILGKSLEGTAAFLVSALAAGLAARLAGQGLPFPTLAAGAATAAAVELLTPAKINDNLTIPLISAGVMTLLGGTPL